MSNFVTLHTGLSGLRAAQFGLEATSNNVANANTEGYTRQRVDQRERAPYTSLVGPIGTGVDVHGVARLRDVLLDSQLRASTAAGAEREVAHQVLSLAEEAFAEPDAGVSVELDRLWDAFDDLTLEPDSDAAKQQVLSALSAVADRFATVSGDLDRVAGGVTDQQTLTVQELQGHLDAVARLNRDIEIPIQSTGTDNDRRFPLPNTLLDERDLALDRIAELTGATVTHNENRTVTVSLGGVTLVQGSTAGVVAADGRSVDGSAITPRGALGGLHAALDVTLPAQHQRLDDLAVALRDALETAHGTPLLAGTGAGDLTVAATTTADVQAGVGDPYDTSRAEALAALRHEPVGGQTINEQLRSIVTRLAGDVAAAGRAAGTQQELTAAVAARRSAAHGVSIDEEMVGLVQYQRALEASSRVMTAVDEALNVLINRTGLVGR